MNKQILIKTVWPRAKKMAFWDQGHIEYKTWRADFNNNKINVIVSSVNFMRASDLIDLLGQNDFIKFWTSLRHIKPLNPIKRTILDGAWSSMVVGDPTIKVNPDIRTFHAKKRHTLKTIAQSEGNESIYALAKRMGRNYRRVFDDVKDFENKKLIRLIENIKQGKRYLAPQLIH